MQNRHRRNKLKRIERKLLLAEKEYYTNVPPLEEKKNIMSLEYLSEIFSEIFGENITFVDVTPKKE